MPLRVIPGRTLFVTLAAIAVAVLVALLIGMDAGGVAAPTAAAGVALAALSIWDCVASRRAWRQSSVRMTRGLPAAFAIGVKRLVPVTIEAEGTAAWQCEIYDHADSTLLVDGMPLRLELAGNARVETGYAATPRERGRVVFSPADVRVRSRWGFWMLLERLGVSEERRVYPNFAQVARYAWLAGDQRLQEIGIKTYQLRGQGTDFKQLTEYQVGDPVRHIDWRATLRLERPIVREFQDERDQRVVLLIDCGRRMRAADRRGDLGGSHFDQVLNAVLLLSYVALKQGDAVGAVTFGADARGLRAFMPRKGAHALTAMMSQLYDVEPSPTHSDYLAAARHLLQTQRKRALVIVVTNFRDEDTPELGSALRLLRARHLVVLASLRERVVGELAAQPLAGVEAAIAVASAHLYEQSRRDAFRSLAARDGLMVDAEPDRLGIELVNRYHAIKRAGLI